MTFRKCILSLCVLGTMLPVSAHAAVIFTEVMYDLPGTDSGREWLEITNTGGSLVDVAGYSLFEGDSAHMLVLVSGNGLLQPGTSAVIASDPAKFGADWPNYSGTLLDSSFSLSNEGEVLELRSGSDVIDSLTYNSSMGAKGDGNTLQRSTGRLNAALPTPGTHTAISTLPPERTASTTPVAESQEEYPESGSSGGAGAYVPPPSALFLEVKGSRSAVREVPLRMSARVTTKGGVLDPSASISWSFGDGSFSTGNVAEKVYRYPGIYLVVVRAIDGGVEARQEFPIVVTSAKVRVSFVTGEGITIANDSKERLDLSGWRLLSDGRVFRIPEGMMILPETSVLLPWGVTNLPIAFDAALQYPGGVVASQFSPNLPAPNAVESAVQVKEVLMQLPIGAESYTQVGTKSRSSVDEKKSSIVTTSVDSQSYDEGILAPAGANELAAAGAALPGTTTEDMKQNSHLSTLLHSSWTYGLLGIIALAGSVFISL